MRILLVNYRYFISGGPEKYMFNVKKLLEEKGQEVIPFSVHSDKNVKSEYSKYFVEPIGSRDAVYFEEVKKTPKSVMQMIGRSAYSFEVGRAIKKEIEDVKPDLVYIIHFVNKLSPSVITTAKKCGVPVVLRLSDYFMLCPRFDFLSDRHTCEDCLKGRYSSCIRKRCVKGSLAASLIRVCSMKLHKMLKVYDKVDAFITPSGFLKSKLVEAGYPEEKIHHIPTFTTITASDPVSSGAGDDALTKERYALYFGRITPEKGVDVAVKAYETMPDKRLLIVGDDTTPEACRLKEYVEYHELNNIVFVGFKKGAELETLIEAASFTIIPSVWYDNLPNTALESFAHHKAVIASRIGSLPELVTDGENGYLFSAGDADALAAKVRMLDADDAKRDEMGRAGAKRLDDVFGKERHYGSLISVFNKFV